MSHISRFLDLTIRTIKNVTIDQLADFLSIRITNQKVHYLTNNRWMQHFEIRMSKIGFHKQRIVLRSTEFDCFNGPFFMQTRMRVFEFLLFFFLSAKLENRIKKILQVVKLSNMLLSIHNPILT